MNKNKRNNIPIIIIIKATTTTQMCKSAAGKCAKIRRVLASSFAIGNSIRAIEGSSSSIGGGGGCGSLCCKWECCNLKWRITGSNTYEDYLGWCTATSRVQRERAGKCDCILWIVNARVLHFHLASIYNMYINISEIIIIIISSVAARWCQGASSSICECVSPPFIQALLAVLGKAFPSWLYATLKWWWMVVVLCAWNSTEWV